MSDRLALGGVVVVAALVTLVSLLLASTGVREGEGRYGTAQPGTDELTKELTVQAAYDDDQIYWRFSWETDNPGFHHDFLVYEDGEWVRHGGEPDGAIAALNEDRLTFLLDDGSVDGFEHYGGFMTVHSFTRNMSPEDTEGDEVEAVYGEGTDDLRKQLPETLEDQTDWASRRSDDDIAGLQQQGYFLDLWHWRAHRSNPIGFSDDQFVLDHRISDDGEGPYSTNFDDDAEQPEFMFDPDATGQHAMSWDRVLDLDYTHDDVYYLGEDTAVPFDPDHDWQDGDAIPRRVLSEPEGPRGAIFAQGIARDGSWDLELQRALDTGAEGQDKALEEFGRYDVAFAVHANGTGNRWHYIGMPRSLGLGRDADIEAVRVDGPPDWDALDRETVTLFYPGVIGWDYITDRASHAGAGNVEANASFYEAHEEEKMAFYALESEFRPEIIGQWLATSAVWLLFIVAVTVAFVPLARRVGKQRDGAEAVVDEDALSPERTDA